MEKDKKPMMPLDPAIKKSKPSKTEKLKGYVMKHAKAEAVKISQAVINENPQGFLLLSVCDDTASHWHETRDITTFFGGKVTDFNTADMSVNINGAKYQLALIGGKDDKPIEILTKDGETFNSKILTGRPNGARPYYAADGSKITPR